MKPDKTIMRQRLDQRLLALGVAIGEPPPHGWLREIRLALSMSTVELAQRMAISQPRASRLERGEVDGTIRLSILQRAAEALNCSLHYVLVPDEALEDMMLRQAHHKATQDLQEIKRSTSDVPIASDEPSDEKDEGTDDHWLEVRTLQLIDTQGLWLEGRPQTGF